MLQLFEEVQRKHVRGQMNPGFEMDLSDSVPQPQTEAGERAGAEEETEAEMDDTLDTNSASDDNL